MTQHRTETDRLVAMCSPVVADARRTRIALDALAAHIECRTAVLREMRREAAIGARVAELKRISGAS
ncbi:hypothetical protein CCR97_08110 [Rhodoplanes elegans]|uniref:Uncharacterized protein n=1 Tax=Rhodoplanes elegans TaxID=29408 RepID=A0A327KNJ0_9BRAD|nr:hypothetical protein [Rhodoplanes elegans]MBK5958083.1 hypothetical protein [Rhodoplanes elegans]MBK5958175.1 hypothetical protein [Rhodoplanes elegans]RAI40459.1 hypothetical protein CH338_06355 [Rhodoplanes elegans]